MIHNGIEYGIMATHAEGLNILRHANVGAEGREADFAEKALSAMRREFGAHAEQPAAATA